MDKIDTSVFTNYRNPYAIDVQERGIKQQTMAMLVDQNKRADMQFQQQQEDRQANQQAAQLKLERDNKIKALYASNTDQSGRINYDQLIPQLYHIDPDLGQKTETNYNDILGKKALYGEHIANAQKANEELNKVKLDARMKEYGLAYNVLSGVKQFDNESWQNAKQFLLQSGLSLEMPDGTPINIPDKYDANFVQGLNGMSTTIGDAFTRQQDIDKAKLEREKFEEEKRKSLAGEGTERYKAETERLKASTQTGTGAADETGLNRLPSVEEGLASDLAFAKIDPQSFSSMYSKRKDGDILMRRVYDRAKQMNPEFNFAANRADFQSYKNNAQRTQKANIERAEYLLDSYQKLSDAVKRNDLVAANKVANLVKINLSNLDATSLNSLQIAMTEDLSRALTQTGATSDKKMDLAGDLSEVMNVSNKAAIEKIKILREILSANKQAIKGNWGAYGKKDEGKKTDNDPLGIR